MLASFCRHTEIVKLLLSQPGIIINGEAIKQLIILIEKKNSQMATEIDQLKATKSELENEFSRLKTTNSQMATEIDQLKATNSKLENEFTRLKTTRSQMATEIDQLKATNSELENEFARLTTTKSELENEFARLESFFFALKETSTELQQVSFNDYEECSILGNGAQSTVRKIYKKEEYAKKELKRYDHKSLQRFLKESEVLVQLRHPCIVRIIGFDYGDSSYPPSIFLKLAQSSLEESIKKHTLTKEEKNRITVDIVLGVRYIHANRLMHRDLKPANILLSKNKHVRISDFGLTKEEDIEASQSKGIGTPLFMAPELIDEEVNPQEQYSSKIDVYSFGFILIYIVSEQYPRYGLKNKLNGIPPTLPPTIIPWVADLIQRCLRQSPSERPTFHEIFEVLKSHDFDLFNETKPTKPTIQQRKAKEEIEHRVLKIEAFEYQHRH